MISDHQLLEIRIGRNNRLTPEAAGQVFAGLPKLHDHWWDYLLRHHEQLSFEILTWQQTVYFLCFVPNRLSSYIQSLLAASYPGILIIPLPEDPLTYFDRSKPSSLGHLSLAHRETLPLRTYHDFSEQDPLSPPLQTMAQLKSSDAALLQFVIKPQPDAWRNLATEEADPQQHLIDKKTAIPALRATIRLVVQSENSNRSKLVLETIGRSYQSLNNPQGNKLQLKQVRFMPGQFWKKLRQRQQSFASQLFSLDELASMFHLPTADQAAIPNLAWGTKLLGEPPENLPILDKSSSAQQKSSVNVYARTIYKNRSVVYGLTKPDRRRHQYVIGKTGTGKSTLLANMAINDLKNNEGLCVIDPHGDLINILLDYIPARRINDVIYFDPTDPEKTVKINLFEGENVAHRELIASGIVAVFKKLYGYSWGPRLEYILRNALLTLLKTEQARLSDIVELLTNARFRQQVLENLDDEILTKFWEFEFDAMHERQRTEAIAPILNKVGQFVSSPIIRDVVNARKSSFSIEDAMDSGKIMLINLSQGRLGEDNAALLGAMMITKLQLAAMARVDRPEEKRRDFYLYVDEFQNFATESFTKVLSEARKYRLNLILANQYVAQIPEEVQKSIFGNCGSLVSFVMGADDAQVFTREFNNRYTTDELVSLGRFQIINKIAIDDTITDPFPGETLPLAKSSNQNREKVIKVSRERYASKKS